MVAELDPDGAPLAAAVPLPRGAFAPALLLAGVICGAEVLRRRAASLG